MDCVLVYFIDWLTGVRIVRRSGGEEEETLVASVLVLLWRGEGGPEKMQDAPMCDALNGLSILPPVVRGAPAITPKVVLWEGRYITPEQLYQVGRYVLQHM